MLGFISYACNELQQAAGTRGCLPVTLSTNEVGQACRPRRSAQGETGRQLPTSLLPDTSPGDSQYHFLIPTASLPQRCLDQEITSRLPFAGPCPGSSVVAQDQHLWMAGCSFPLQTQQPSICPMKAPGRFFTPARSCAPARSALLPGTALLAGPGNRHRTLVQSHSKLRTEAFKGCKN